MNENVTAAHRRGDLRRAKTSARYAAGLESLLSEIQIISVDLALAQRFGEIRAGLLDIGRPVPVLDLMIAATALTYDLTLVTHNVADFQGIPDLRIEDWSA